MEERTLMLLRISDERCDIVVREQRIGEDLRLWEGQFSDRCGAQGDLLQMR